MSTEVTRLDLRLRRRSLIGYSLGMAVYVFVIVALYPTFKDDTSLNQFTEKSSTVAALFGASGPLTSPTGWLNANLYGNFVPLIVLMMTIGYGASALAGQNEDGTLGVLASVPVSRHRLVVQKFAAMCLLAIPVAVATMLVVLVGRAFDLPVGYGHLVAITIGVVLLGMVFGALALVLGAATGSRALALGIAAGVAATCYLISSLAASVHWIRPARFLSRTVGNGQLVNGIGAASIIVLVLVIVALLATAVRAFERLDIR